MHRLTGQDAYFCYQDTASTMMHTLKIGICETGELNPKPTTELIIANMKSCLHLIPACRRRIIDVPFGLHHPVFIEDPEFDIDFHIRHAAVCSPGESKQLNEVLGWIASVPLDRSRPLWELTLLEGLAGGKVAFVLKLHHSVADGIASATFINNVMGVGMNIPPPPEQPWQAESIPDNTRLIVDAIWDLLVDFTRLPGLVQRTRSHRRSVEKRNRTALVIPPVAYSEEIVKTRLNGALSARRVFATTQSTVSKFKTISKHLGGTINDTVLAVSAGALRHYLADYGETPDKPLVCGVPVAADKDPDVARSFGNCITYLHTRLRSDLADPVQRYQATREVSDAAKEILELMGRDTVPDWMEYIPAPLFSWQKRRDNRQKKADQDNFPLPSNVSISNVRGPNEACTAGGFRVSALYSAGLLVEGIALNITVWSYAGQMNFGINCCKKIIPNPERIAELIDSEIDVLYQLCQQHNGAAGRNN